MMKKTTFLTLFLAMATFTMLFAQIPDGYYTAAEGKKGYELQKALNAIISNNAFVIDYGSTDAARLMDLTDEGYIYDIYSYPCCNITHFGTATNEQCTKYSFEHIFCQNWFNPNGVYNVTDHNPFPVCSDLHHVFPTDHYVNSSYHNNSPYGEVTLPRKISQNGTQWGYTNADCFSDTNIATKPFFEPVNEFKGDVARALLYISIRYMFLDENFADTSDMTYRSQFKPWALEMLKKWHSLDPVSEKERTRNDKIYTFYQFNRNPLIDHPELVELIWGVDSLYDTFGNKGAQDAERPTVTKVTCTENQIVLTFSKSLDVASAEDINNYSVTKGICIESAACSGNTVTLTVSGKLVRNTRYHVYCNGVKSTDGLFVKAGSFSGTYGDYNSWYTCSQPREVLAAWTFDEFEVKGNWPLSVPAGAEIGIPEIFNHSYLYADSTHGASLWDSVELNNGTGNLSGDPRAAAKAGKALALKKKTANGKSVVIMFPTKGWKEIMVDFAATRTSTGFATHSWEWSLDGENYTPLNIENTIADYGDLLAKDWWWIRQIDLRELSAINDQDSVFLRLTVDDATGTSGSNTLDNIVIYGENLNYVPDFTSIPQLPDNDFNVYPNPNNGQFEIACAENSAFTSLQLFDMSGRLVLKQDINDKIISVSMDNRPSGIYFVKMIDSKNGKAITKKIVVTK